jgi:Fe-S-cluster-containing dehydrogenase component
MFFFNYSFTVCGCLRGSAVNYIENSDSLGDKKLKKRYVMVIDQERCIGCEACTIACKIENKGAAGWIQVATQNSGRKDIPTGRFPHLEMHFLPTLCNHCDHPPCVDACPIGAIAKLDSGIVILAEELCDGCRTCLDACPYGAIEFNNGKDKAEKCNLCSHRIENDLDPFCVICCEGQAIHFGDLNDPVGSVSKMLESSENFHLKSIEDTGPAVYYLPPKAPRGLQY